MMLVIFSCLLTFCLLGFIIFEFFLTSSGYQSFVRMNLKRKQHTHRFRTKPTSNIRPKLPPPPKVMDYRRFSVSADRTQTREEGSVAELTRRPCANPARHGDRTPTRKRAPECRDWEYFRKFRALFPRGRSFQTDQELPVSSARDVGHRPGICNRFLGMVLGGSLSGYVVRNYQSQPLGMQQGSESLSLQEIN